MTPCDRRDSPNPYRAAAILFFILCATSHAKAQTTEVSGTEVEKRVDAILSKMTRDEKLTIIGGINDFYIQAIPRLGLPGAAYVGWPTRRARLRTRDCVPRGDLAIPMPPYRGL